MYSRGSYILFADADGATDIRDLESVMEWTKKIEKNGLGCAIGSRKEGHAVVQVIF